MDEKIILENQNLIYYAATYFKNYPYKEDLYQAGRLGMIEAYKRYNPNMGSKFTTYAFFDILGEMKKLVKSDKGIKVSRDISKLNLKIEKAYVLLTQKLMKEPSIKEIASFLEIPEYYVSEAILSLNKIKSIDEAINDDGREFTLQDVKGEYKSMDDLILLNDALKSLNKEEFAIIENRYMKDYTQNETSKIVGMSQVQVSRIEKRILVNKFYQNDKEKEKQLMEKYNPDNLFKKKY